MTADAGEADRSPAGDRPQEPSPEAAPLASADLRQAIPPVDPDPDTDSGPDPGARAGPGPETETGIDPADVDVEALTGPERSLDPRVRLVWISGALITAVLLGGMVSVGSVLVFGQAWPGGLATATLAVLGSVHALLRYRSWSYEVRADSLYLERGVFTRVSTVVPYVRIQHVDVSRGPIERLVGLATTVVYTAGSRGADVSVPGLTPEDAEGLQRRLKRLAIAAEGDDAV
jgi:membrane protein YdbS with pleckstrin-like domain